ncbi:methenyltetrahydrofolate synthetase [Flavonifractor sp. An92]|uniref:5-formyltetrahydrofolate cyclo-ligase n=1 Tax=Flavonifractor sp. An92 TaxID=1965666 RepID=UPI000B38B75C|nr:MULTISPECIES: 5-formyltetrahydrofolate cyclo-ligase [unclassified Flavonifractor]OUN06026.1 methenyltetrahydrofolate synthetase [Flavonifractor sp. An92]OUQ23987.1 methenyltetrahydrofolate synthetase [Flavonifractor sp. An135]
MVKHDAKYMRVQTWEALRKVARPDSRFSWDFAEFITDYEGSEQGAERIAAMDLYQKAKVIFITPDNNLEKLREIAFRDKKTVVMTNYGITRGFFLIAPGMVPEGKEEVASLLDGVARYWKHQTLAQLKESVGHIDLMVTGASTVTPGGIRFGKGHGYFDLEWAMTYTAGLVDVHTPVIGAGHDCQVVDADVEVQPHDTAIDYIVTPTRVIPTRSEYPKPTCGILWSALEPQMRGQIPPIQELWCQIHCK